MAWDCSVREKKSWLGNMTGKDHLEVPDIE